MKKMTKNYEILVMSDDDQAFIDNEFDNLIRSALHVNQDEPLFTLLKYVVKNEGKIIGGTYGSVCLGSKVLLPFILYVDKNYRNQGIGSFLLRKIEDEAKLLGATIAHLDSYDWQDYSFYLQHGYEVISIIEDYPPGHKHYYLKKWL